MGLETSSILHRAAYRVSFKGTAQRTCLLGYKAFVGLRLDDFLKLLDPVGAILGRGSEFAIHSVEAACQLLVGDYEHRSGTNLT